MRDFSGMNTYELTQRLAREKPECPVCHKPCDPQVDVIEIIVVPIPDPDKFDLAGLLPVHNLCAAEARDRLQRAQVDVDFSRGMGEIEEYLRRGGV